MSVIPISRKDAGVAWGAPQALVNLHITHSWGGGLGRWADDFATHDPYSRNLILSSRGTVDAYGLVLSLRDPVADEELSSWVMQHPICEVASEHGEYRQILESILCEYGVDHLYISSFIGQSLDLLRLEVPTSIIYHDFFPFCQAISITFSDVCTSCTDARLKRCLKENDLAYLFRQNSARYWLKFRQDYLNLLTAKEGCQHIAPSANVVRYLQRLDYRYRRLRFEVIGHGTDFAKKNCFGGAEAGRRLRVLLLGRLDEFKGLGRLRRIYETLRTTVDLFLLGAGEGAAEFDKAFGVEYLDQYASEDLPAHLASIRPDVALFLSEIPETFSYTLSEAFAHCIPAVAFPMGSFEDRIESGNNGLLVERRDEAVIDALLGLDRNRELLRGMAKRLGEVPVRTVGEMVGDYYQLRTDLPDRLSGYLGSLSQSAD